MTNQTTTVHSSNRSRSRAVVAGAAVLALSFGAVACSDDDGNDDDIDNPVDGVDDQIDDGLDELEQEVDSETDE